MSYMLCVTLAAVAVAVVTLILCIYLYRRLLSNIALLQQHSSNQSASLQELATLDEERAASWQASNQPIALLVSRNGDLATKLYQLAITAYGQQKFAAARHLWQ